MKCITRIGLMALLPSLIVTQAAKAQILDKTRLGYSRTGINNYVLEMSKRTAIFKKNRARRRSGLLQQRLLLSQELIAGTFDLSFFRGSEATVDCAIAHSVQVLDRQAISHPGRNSDGAP